MHSLFKGVFICALAVLASCSPAPNPKCQSETVEEAKKAERALADFAVNLYKNVTGQSQQQDKNQVISPISVALALAILENGANGETRRELDRQLVENGASPDQVLSVYRALEKQLTIDQSKTRLQIANAVYHDKKVQLKQDYQQSTQQCLDSQIQEVDFKNQLEDARQKINRFISEKTKEKIPELIKKGILAPDTEVVVANAISLKAAWQKVFNKKDTKPGPFYRHGQQQQQQVQFMKIDGQYRHSADEKLQVVELKYEKTDLSMYVLLPKQRDGLKELERSLNGDRLRSILSNLKQEQVQIQLPRFAVRSPSNLKSVLAKMGLPDLFDRRADLSRMSQEKLEISQAIHEAYIKIDEDGTEAAAASAHEAVNQAVVLPRDQAQFIADHPFMYTIVHNPTGAVVFIGKVEEVQEKADE